jgi:hypothetical protein
MTELGPDRDAAPPRAGDGRATGRVVPGRSLRQLARPGSIPAFGPQRHLTPDWRGGGKFFVAHRPRARHTGVHD